VRLLVMPSSLERGRLVLCASSSPPLLELDAYSPYSLVALLTKPVTLVSLSAPRNAIRLR
jgi:hypothetical protein